MPRWDATDATLNQSWSTINYSAHRTVRRWFCLGQKASRTRHWRSWIQALDQIVSEKLFLAVWIPSIKKGKVSHLWSSSNAPLETKEEVSLEMHMGNLQKMVSFLVVPNLTTNVILETAFNGQLIEKIQSGSRFPYSDQLMFYRDCGRKTTRPRLDYWVSRHRNRAGKVGRQEAVRGCWSNNTCVDEWDNSASQYFSRGYRSSGYSRASHLERTSSGRKRYSRYYARNVTPH